MKFPESRFESEEIHLDLEFTPQPDESLPFVAINMVISLDGRVEFEGRSGGIGGTADRRVMRNLRSNFDAVMRGGNSLRSEKILTSVPEDLALHRVNKGLSSQPFEVVITSSGEVPLGSNLTGSSPERILVVSDLSIKEMSEVQDIPSGVRSVDSGSTSSSSNIRESLISLKRDYGIKTVLSEGGPSLTKSLIKDNLAQNLFLTVSPKVLGRERGKRHQDFFITEDEQIDLGKLISVHTSDNETFLRYAISFR